MDKTSESPETRITSTLSGKYMTTNHRGRHKPLVKKLKGYVHIKRDRGNLLDPTL